MVKETVNNGELIGLVAKVSGRTKKDVKEVIDALDWTVANELSKATEEKEIEVKILPSGVNVYSDYVPSKTYHSPLTGENITSSPKLKLKAKFGAKIKRKINE